MNKNKLLEIIHNGESSKVEFKTDSVHPASLAEEIVAFLNFKGGKIILGVDDSGVIRGCSKKNFEEFIINICRNNVHPPVIPLIEKVIMDDKTVFILTIDQGEIPHCSGKGIYHIRVGSTKQIPTQQELVRLFQHKNVFQYDETPVLKAGINSIDLLKVDNYLMRLGQSPLAVEDSFYLGNELNNLSILVELGNHYYPTLGGLLAFGKDPQKYFPSYQITCGAYKGKDVVSEIISEKNLKGSLDEQIKDAMSFLTFVVHQDRSLINDTQRKDEYQYPMEAMREAIVNAVCHRDYTISGASIRILMFQDRIEIRSPGGLPNTLTLDSMIYRQFTRNQTIASFLSGSGYMEKRGKGLLKIMKLCKAHGISHHFSLMPDGNEFVVTFSE